MMQFEDPRLEAYFRTLPPDVQAFLEKSGRDISSLGELMQVGEHFRKEFGHDGTEETVERNIPPGA